MTDLPACPHCAGSTTYPDGSQWACADCGHAWVPGDTVQGDAVPAVRDCNGTMLVEGDTVVVTRDLKVKGTSVPLKQGTLIRGIRLVDGDVAHVEGNVDRIRGLVVKTCYVRRA